MESKDLRVGYRCRQLLNKWRQKDFTELEEETKEFKKYVNTYGFEEIYALKKSCDNTIRRRTKLRAVLKAYIELNRPIYFVTLTFDDAILETRELKNVKRKARRFLFDVSDYYTFIEEYGEEKDRYHLHGLVILKDDNWENIKSWSYRQNIKRVKVEAKETIKRVPKYLAKYLSKQDTRITMCKNSISLLKDYKNCLVLNEFLDIV